jgi:hypothetical protein
MIRHNVFFQIHNTTSQDSIANAFNLLFGLKDKIAGFLRIAGGKCNFHENKGLDHLYGFSIDFANEDAYNTFLTDQITDQAKSAIINIAVNGYEGIYGFDIGKTIETFPNPLDKYRTPTPRLLPPGSIR